MGDAPLAEFASVVDAVQCAVAIQRAMAGRESNVAEHQRIRFRVGINLGDVIIEGDDIYGDGVNIAARLEGLAEPGGIVISGTAFDHARSKAQAGFRFLGRQQVKNIPEPVRALSGAPRPEGGRYRHRRRGAGCALALAVASHRCGQCGCHRGDVGLRWVVVAVG